MSGATIRAALLTKYPRRYEINMEHHLNCTIQNLVTKYEKIPILYLPIGPINNASDAQSELHASPPVTRFICGKEYPFPESYVNNLRAAVSEYSSFMPRYGHGFLMQHIKLI